MNRGVIIFVLGVVLVGAWTSFFTIDEAEYAIVTQFGQYKRSVTDPGPHWKLPWQTVLRMDNRILGSDTPPGELLTADKKFLVTDPITRWRIKDPFVFYKTVRDVNSAKRRIDDIVLSELRTEIATKKFGDIIGNKREPLMQAVGKAVRDKVKEFGIEVVDVRIKRADLKKEVEQSVFQRMRAEREREAKRYRSEGAEEAAKIRADADKERRILLAGAYETQQKLRGEGDAESTKIYAEAFGKDPEFYAFLRSLETYEKSIDKDSTVVLSSGSDLFKYLTQRKPQP